MSVPIGYERVDCCECGIAFYVPGKWRQNKVSTGGDFKCPNGHGLTYGDSEADTLRRERDKLKQRIAYKDDRINSLNQRVDGLQKSRAAVQGHLTRVKKRAKAGVCPCCNRTFKQLAAHMAEKHPDFDPSEQVAAE